VSFFKEAKIKFYYQPILLIPQKGCERNKEK